MVRNEEGKYECERCGKGFDTIMGLGSHRKRCDGGLWRCGWCVCSIEETSGKSPGPQGPGTLCSTCSSRWKSGHTGPPERNEDGRYPCDKCERTFETFAALGVHSRNCDGGNWRCNWCKCSAQETSGKSPGPDGPRTLCGACASRYRAGATGPPVKDADGKYPCERCGRQFDTIPSLGGHNRFCDGGNWRCGWCDCKRDECSGKGPGPKGPQTLCSTCSTRFRAGHIGERAMHACTRIIPFSPPLTPSTHTYNRPTREGCRRPLPVRQVRFYLRVVPRSRDPQPHLRRRQLELPVVRDEGQGGGQRAGSRRAAHLVQQLRGEVSDGGDGAGGDGCVWHVPVRSVRQAVRDGGGIRWASAPLRGE